MIDDGTGLSRVELRESHDAYYLFSLKCKYAKR